MTRSLHVRAVAALAVTAAGLAGCTGLTTYGTGEAPELAILNEVSGGIGLGGKKDPIDYQPRAPLVLPPSTQLRDPIQTAEATNPAWPKDPDKRGTLSQGEDEEITDAEREELKRYAYLNSQRRKEGPFGEARLTPEQRRQQNAKFQSAINEREGNSATERRYLTEPPLDYRAPAATAPTEFEDIGPEKKGFFRRLFRG